MISYTLNLIYNIISKVYNKTCEIYIYSNDFINTKYIYVKSEASKYFTNFNYNIR